MKRFPICVALAALGCGCISNNPKDFAPLVKALSGDPATAHIVVRAASFSLEIERANPGSNTVAHSVGPISVGR